MSRGLVGENAVAEKLPKHGNPQRPLDLLHKSAAKVFLPEVGFLRDEFYTTERNAGAKD